jgi:hypothetical protein
MPCRGPPGLRAWSAALHRLHGQPSVGGGALVAVVNDQVLVVIVLPAASFAPESDAVYEVSAAKGAARREGDRRPGCSDGDVCRTAPAGPVR